MEFAVQCMDSPKHTLALAEWAEQRNLACFAPADHYVSAAGDAWDQITLLGAVAARTRSIELATLVSPITFRHPAVMLKSAVTLDGISGGRFSLGVGTGWMEREHEVFGIDMPPVSERFDRLEEALSYLRAALDPSAPGFEGRFYRLEAGFLPAPLPKNLRIVVGGSGAHRTPYLAGTYADEYNVFPDTDVDIPALVERARDAARAAGRDPDALLISTAFPGIAGGTKSEFEDMLTRIAKRRDTAADALLDRMRILGIPHGTVEQVKTGITSLADQGVQRIYLQVSYLSLEDIQAIVGVFTAN